VHIRNSYRSLLQISGTSSRVFAFRETEELGSVGRSALWDGVLQWSTLLVSVYKLELKYVKIIYKLL